MWRPNYSHWSVGTQHEGAGIAPLAPALLGMATYTKSSWLVVALHLPPFWNMSAAMVLWSLGQLTVRGV